MAMPIQLQLTGMNSQNQQQGMGASVGPKQNIGLVTVDGGQQYEDGISAIMMGTAINLSQAQTQQSQHNIILMAGQSMSQRINALVTSRRMLRTNSIREISQVNRERDESPIHTNFELDSHADTSI
jgi:hypothetical protein